MNRNRQEKGITLIALVVTIIVLLILAGVTLSFVAGENGILKRATSAVNQHNFAAAEEALSLKLAEIVADKLDKDLNYLEGMEIEGYHVKVSDIGRIVTMTKNNEPYVFFVDSNYNVNRLDDINIVGGGNGNNDHQETIEDYTDNLLYKANFHELLKQENGVTVVGSGIEVDSTNTYATFDGASGIAVPAEEVDPEGKLLGTTDKTITLWYRTDSAPTAGCLPLLVGGEDYGRSCFFNLTASSTSVGVHHGKCDVAISPANRYDNQWHFIVGVFKQGNTTLQYFDGLGFEGKGSYNTSKSNVSIGYSYMLSPWYFKGDLADARVYSAALTGEQVDQLYRYGKDLLKDK